MSQYKLVKQEIIEKYIITVEGDMNDADYTSAVTVVKPENFTESLVTALQVLTEFCDSREDDTRLENLTNEFFDIPGTCDYPCHSLEKLTVEYHDGKGNIYDLILEPLSEDTKNIVNEDYSGDAWQYMNDLYCNK